MTFEGALSVLKKRKLKKINGYDVLLTLFVVALTAFAALPLVYLVSSAFKPIDEILRFPPLFLVRQPTLQNFRNLVLSLSSTSVPFIRYVFNSLLVTVVTVGLSVIICSMGAFGLVKHTPVGARWIMNLVIVALMFSGFVTQIPNYLLVINLGMNNTYWALILPKVAVAYNFFLMERFTGQIPDEILEAARIDGARERHIFWKIVMPMLGPAWSTLIVFAFVASWNDAFGPLVYIQSQAMKTLPLAMQTIAGGTGASDLGRMGATMAAALITTMPTIIIFVLMQGRVIKTMAYSGIKG